MHPATWVLKKPMVVYGKFCHILGTSPTRAHRHAQIDLFPAGYPPRCEWLTVWISDGAMRKFLTAMRLVYAPDFTTPYWAGLKITAHRSISFVPSFTARTSQLPSLTGQWWRASKKVDFRIKSLRRKIIQQHHSSAVEKEFEFVFFFSWQRRRLETH